MTDDIQKWIATPPPADEARLNATEDAVWTRVGEIGERRRVNRLRIAAVALALTIGGVNGGLILQAPKPAPSEMRIFTVSAGLSPLASLDAHG
jgi:hypothetical protein